MVVAPILGSFVRAYPDVRLELVIDDSLVDVVAAGFDAANAIWSPSASRPHCVA